MSNQIARLLQAGSIGILPTDTVYGFVASALVPASVERLYTVRGRDVDKPCIILLATITDIEQFGITLTTQQQSFLTALWPARVSVILPCVSERYAYLHRGTCELAFRIPEDANMRMILAESGPIIAPSANPQGLPTACTIEEAKTYFGDRADFFLDRGTISGVPSTLLRLFADGQFEILRQGDVFIS